MVFFIRVSNSEYCVYFAAVCFAKKISVVISFYHLPLPSSVDVYFCGCCDCQLAGSLYSIATMVALPIHFDDTVCDEVAI